MWETLTNGKWRQGNHLVMGSITRLLRTRIQGTQGPRVEGMLPSAIMVVMLHTHTHSSLTMVTQAILLTTRHTLAGKLRVWGANISGLYYLRTELLKYYFETYYLICYRYAQSYVNAYGAEGYHNYMRNQDPTYDAFYAEGPSVDDKWRSTYPYVPTSYLHQQG